ncbi:helix-turn-helix domain-containing protein [Actinoplanes oblitus]|uniref:Helix-turn-helix domain-containing protein n=1 Tax=Actinoplanes oblitus TaxID=3040509 RepID=A0ABY8WK72_9ACTN|nr:helix-turn-helix domain-containing protein [Actinoplanes oblitus]WIM97802.1 helix-turn-helix domain-containing protein [Actinoplanes oblitus]
MHGDKPSTDSTHGTFQRGDEQIAYSAKHAGAVLDLSERTVQNLIANGRIRSFLEGRSRRISRRALEEYCRNREAESA